MTNKLIDLSKLSRQVGYETNRIRRVLRLEKYCNKIELIKLNKTFYIKVEDLNKLVAIVEEARMICRAVIKKLVNVIKIKAIKLEDKGAKDVFDFIRETVETFEDYVISAFPHWLSPETYSQNRETFRRQLMIKVSKKFM